MTDKKSNYLTIQTMLYIKLIYTYKHPERLSYYVDLATNLGEFPIYDVAVDVIFRENVYFAKYKLFFQ